MLESFQRRLNGTMSDHRTAQSACIGFLPLLTSILDDTTNLPLRHASLSTIDTIVKKFGKMDLAAVFTAASVVSRDHVLGAPESSLRRLALVCLANGVELLRGGIIPIVPTILPKALDQLRESMKENTKNDGLHHTAYLLICSFLSHIPWTISVQCLERILTHSHQSTKSQMGDVCDQIRVETLRLVAKHVEPQKCFYALNGAWKSVMDGGPIVSFLLNSLLNSYSPELAYN